MKLAVAFAALIFAAPLAAQTPEETAAAALEAAPVWDGHNDVPIQLRARFGNVIDAFDFEDTSDTGPSNAEGQAMHTDFARLAQGHVGAQFWSVYVSPDLAPRDAVIATIEQIDVTKRLVAISAATWCARCSGSACSSTSATSARRRCSTRSRWRVLRSSSATPVHSASRRIRATCLTGCSSGCATTAAS